ncbi:type II toxin-antitoxin system RelE/ParE family toxin [Methylorubrum thiocyanatum]|uniref:type II toxin-antitoxin system RelE/ParE family toxin n=1 Tax=Methylorubrum thiocyanatum TaxID=47958 RepID=UPI00398C4BAB
MHAVIETPYFLADAKSAEVTPEEVEAIKATIADDPTCGDQIKGTGGARKVRIGGKGKGKSGGYRVFFFPTPPDVPVFLLRLLSKGQKSNLTKNERNAIKAYLSTLVDDYRESVRKAAAKLRRKRKR